MISVLKAAYDEIQVTKLMPSLPYYILICQTTRNYSHNLIVGPVCHIERPSLLRCLFREAIEYAHVKALCFRTQLYLY